MSPSRAVRVRSALHRMSCREAATLADEALTARRVAQVRERLAAFARSILGRDPRTEDRGADG
jgi:hypothetical protein